MKTPLYNMNINYYLLFMTLNPLASLHESRDPRSDIVGTTVGWIETALPWEDCTLEVRHHCQVATIVGTDACCIELAAVRIGWIVFVAISTNNIILIGAVWEAEFTLAVSNPNAKSAT